MLLLVSLALLLPLHSIRSKTHTHTYLTLIPYRLAEVWGERSVAADVPLLSWYKSNLEVSCGVGLDKLGLEWNTDEAYGYEGDHVASKYDSL